MPTILPIKANDIEDWARSSLSARSRLAVLLRTLVHSTGLKISAANFPGNDDSERPGWDGFVEAGEATPWIPVGKSGWEFGVNADVKAKADGDYAKSVRHLAPEARAEITFVFVTPRRWPGKAAWESKRRADGNWRDVRVYDASDLEQWLEQSIPNQAWLAHERGVPAEGVLSLDACWRQWSADCKPPLVEALFEEALAGAEATIRTKLLKPEAEAVVVTADSRDEALAFLHCLFAADRPDMAALRDRVIVFSEPGPLTRLASNAANFIPVVTSPAVEKELAPHRANLHAILVYPRNATNADADVRLEPLSYMAFDKALKTMACNRDDIDRLSRESGRSLTVLRRRLSGLGAIRTPAWASDLGLARSLVPFLFAGAWNSSNAADQSVLSLLADDIAYEQLEGNLTSLLQLDDAPVWSIGKFRGLISKIDTLFAINRNLTPADLKRFFEAAMLVLSEDDPALDLPEKDRWSASIYGKTRDISASLRDGICETLVLLAVYGPGLVRERLGVDPSSEAKRLIKDLLTPLTARSLEAHSNDLPMYAEASPDGFLDILEADLASPEPEALKLMRPADVGCSGGCPRSGLLWALENTAWAPERLVRTISILARLAEPKIDDNWTNKPSGSLSSIFRNWMPQTSANLGQRIAALEYLVQRFPNIAWPLCVQQFDIRSRVGDYTHKPRWRPDAHGHGEPITVGEAHAFRARAFDLALGWKAHTRETLGDLIGVITGLDEALQVRVWDMVDHWSSTASDEDRAWLREKVRVSTMTRRARRRASDKAYAAQLVERARRAYDRLKPEDIILEHAWLFRNHWVMESADEIGDEDLDYDKREQRITVMRVEALRAVMADGGLDAALQLAGIGDAAAVVGSLLPQIVTECGEQVEAVRSLLAGGSLLDSPVRRSLVAGLLGRLSEEQTTHVLQVLTEQWECAEAAALLVLAPFRRGTWHLVDTLAGDLQAAYWANVQPRWMVNPEDDTSYVVERLLAAERPSVAFKSAEFHLEQLPPKQLFRLLSALATDPGEAHATDRQQYRFEGYRITDAFKLLNQSKAIPSTDMAGLEFQYLEVFDDDRDTIPNLEHQLNCSPELFVQAIVLRYTRHDNGEDPPPFRALDCKTQARWAEGAYKLLEKLSRTPGRDHTDEIDAERLQGWVDQVRTACAELSRSEACDHKIGKLFSKSPVGTDEVWPCEPVREVIERIATDRFEGVRQGVYNARGVHIRGEGGDQERELAAKYATWARALEFRHPNTAKILRSVEATYEHEASWEDTEAGIRRRLARY